MIHVDRLTLTLPDAPAPVLREVTLTVPEGDLCLVVGRTGAGKSTLLGAINGLVPHFTGGTMRGAVRVAGRSTRQLRPRELADVVGFVPQDPASGFVTDTVEEEVAYGMEQLGLSALTMRKRVEESLDLLGIADLRRRALTGLSGGQQQRVAIASVLAAQPRVVVLDEPTSALDPIAASDVLSALTTLVHEVGLTVVLAEHRLERVMAAADSMIWLPGDGTAHFGTPSQILARSSVTPPLSALARRLAWEDVPLTVRAARRTLAAQRPVQIAEPTPTPTPRASHPVLEVRNATVRYGQFTAVNAVSLQGHSGEVVALMGRNGSGKSSLLWALQGSLKHGGTILVDGINPAEAEPAELQHHVSLVPQNAGDLLYLASVAAECAQSDADAQVSPGSTAALAHDLGVELAMEQHPRDLSEGQRLALVLAIQLVSSPTLVLLDEPTRGLDYAMKQQLARIITKLRDEGRCVLVATHDVEFAAEVADRVIVMGDAEIVADGPAREVVTSSPVFAPQIAKVFFPAPVLRLSDVTPA